MCHMLDVLGFYVVQEFGLILNRLLTWQAKGVRTHASPNIGKSSVVVVKVGIDNFSILAREEPFINASVN